MSDLLDEDEAELKRSFFKRRPSLLTILTGWGAAVAVAIPHVAEASSTTDVVFLSTAGIVMAFLSGAHWALEGVQEALRALKARHPDEVSDIVVEESNGGDSA